MGLKGESQFTSDNRTYNELKEFLENGIVRSEEDKKPPKGFEKFFKKKEQRGEAEQPASQKGKLECWLTYLYRLQEGRGEKEGRGRKDQRGGDLG